MEETISGCHLQVGELSPAAQEVIAKYTCQMGGLAGRYAPMSAATGVLPWTSPAPEDYDLLAQARCPFFKTCCPFLCAAPQVLQDS